MPNRLTSKQWDEISHDVFELIRLVSALRTRSGSEELSETEFVALDLLTKHGQMTVGDIQKHIGILPAQMSRLIRSLEQRGGKPMVECSINADDRRKVDVQITDAGVKAYEKYRENRIQTTMTLLKGLDTGDLEVFMRILRSFRDMLAKKMPA